jgi:hypothetical protein
VILSGTVDGILDPFLDDGLVVRHVQVRIREVVKDRSNRGRPGDIVVVRMYGGTLLVDGREFTTKDPVEPLSVGDEAVLLLRPARDGKSFDIVKGSYGLYRVKDKQTGSVALSKSAARLPGLAGRPSIGKRELIDLLKGAGRDR